MDLELPYRDLCFRCLRAQEVCFCAQIKPFVAGPQIVILIHPKERRKRIGTGRMAHLCISNSRLFEGICFTEDARVKALLADERYFPMLLYPGPDAIQANSAEALRAAIPAGRQPLIFVLDGTWNGARSMARLNPRLRALPRLSFSCTRKSAYKFRQQPFPEAFSTIEAIHFIIDSFNTAGTTAKTPEADYANLLAVFDWMVGKQCSFKEPGTARAIRGLRTRTF